MVKFHMFTKPELIPTEAEKGLWYYQGIDEVGNLYHNEDLMATMLDLPPSAEPDMGFERGRHS